VKHRAFVVTAVVAAALGWAGRSVFSEDAPAAPSAAPSAGDMDEMMKLGQPGEEHTRLAKALVGEWTTRSKMYMGGQVLESEGTAAYDAILGGRFVRQQVTATIAGMPFEGRGLLGFNRGTKQFLSFWIDSMGTGAMLGTGVENEPGTKWTFTSSYDGGPVKMESREVLEVKGPDEFVFTMYEKKGGKEALTLELFYKRKPK
jgi:hypothetical protein